MDNVKHIFESKTFRVACLQGAIGVIVVFQGTYPDIGWLVVAKTLLDIYLRSITTTAVSV